MKQIFVIAVVAIAILMSAADGYCSIKYISGYTKSNGTYVGGHYRDTSNDGNPYNNANYLGYNN
jgi:hypothetical protein